MNPYAFARIRGWAFRLAKSVEWTILNRPSAGGSRDDFQGLYGVESPLPTRYSDDICATAGRRQATEDFLDIFNHRLIAQYYRIWRKYSYPATFRAGGFGSASRPVSAGRRGWGIPGCAAVAAQRRCHRFLALLPVMMLPGGSGEAWGAGGAHGPGDPGDGAHHDPCRIPCRSR